MIADLQVPSGVVGIRRRVRAAVRPRLWLLQLRRTAGTPSRIGRGIRRWAQSPPPDIVWIGDSHARWNPGIGRPPRGSATPILAVAPSGDWSLWIGPRSIYSIAEGGHPRSTLVVSWVLRRLLRRAEQARVVFMLGNIDVRLHLPPRRKSGPLDLGFIEQYVERCSKWVGPGRPYAIAVPIPPHGDEKLTGYLKYGTIDERVACHGDVRRRLHYLSEKRENLLVLDATEKLVDERGQLRPDLTTDGFHLNDAGRRELECSLRDLGLRSSRPSTPLNEDTA